MIEKEIYPKISIYTDGGAEPNPGKGGFGVILIYKAFKKEFSKSYLMTTNNRMELMGVIFALEQLKKSCIVEIYSDSKYVVDGISKGWAENWKSKNWFRRRAEKAINFDLWGELLELIAKHHSVKFSWVKGHSGHPENERCDELANMALQANERIEDVGYLIKLDDEKNADSLLQENTSANNGKILIEGDACKECKAPLIKMSTKRKKIKDNQKYFFEYYLYCPSCKKTYMVEAAKRLILDTGNQLFS